MSLLCRPSCNPSRPPCPQVPPALNRFTRTLDKNMAESLFKLLMKYRPEDKAAKKERLLKEAQVRRLAGGRCRAAAVRLLCQHVCCPLCARTRAAVCEAAERMVVQLSWLGAATMSPLAFGACCQRAALPAPLHLHTLKCSAPGPRHLLPPPAGARGWPGG